MSFVGWKTKSISLMNKPKRCLGRQRFTIVDMTPASHQTMFRGRLPAEKKSRV